MRGGIVGVFSDFATEVCLIRLEDLFFLPFLFSFWWTGCAGASMGGGAGGTSSVPASPDVSPLPTPALSFSDGFALDLVFDCGTFVLFSVGKFLLNSTVWLLVPARCSFSFACFIFACFLRRRRLLNLDDGCALLDLEE